MENSFWIKMLKTFFLTLAFFVLIFFLLSYKNQDSGKTLDEQIQTIEKKIYELEEMKRGYIARYLRHENQAQRLQFVDGQLSVARRHSRLAEKNRLIAEKIQTEIDELQKERKALLIRSGRKPTVFRIEK